jgi:hypothetical protein
MRHLALLLLLLSACPQSPAPLPPPARAAPVRVAHVVATTGLLFADAPRLVSHWRTTAGWPTGAVALVTDLQAVVDPTSALLDGAPAANMLQAANIAAVVPGPRDLDFGLPALLKLREVSGAMPLLANVRETGAPSLAAPTSAVFERKGVRVGVIGISSLTKDDGPFEALPLEGALETTVASTAKQADVVVVLVSGCSTAVRRALDAHPDWKVDLVVASPCEGEKDGRVGTAMVLHPTPGRYASLRVELGAVRSLSAQLVEVPASTPEEPGVLNVRDTWQKLAQTRRAEPVAVVKGTPDLETSALAVAAALRTVPKADAGLFLSKRLRAALPGGEVTRGHVVDALTGFERVFLVDVPGEVLTKLVSHPDAFLSLPAKVEPNGSYVLATTEWVYRTGVGMDAVDANPVDADVLLPNVVMRWLETQGATADKPLVLPVKPARRPTRR